MFYRLIRFADLRTNYYSFFQNYRNFQILNFYKYNIAPPTRYIGRLCIPLNISRKFFLSILVTFVSSFVDLEK